MGYYNSQLGLYYGYVGNLKLKVARAAEADYPHEAVELYLEVACHLIDQRGRKNYADAAYHLTQIRDLYQKNLEPELWYTLIQAVRTENNNLPALQDELNKAGLR